jgi:hypothetical protein
MSSIDVFIPCYNYGRYLAGCVQGALDQDGIAVRVLIIDDASTDDSELVGRRLAAEDRRVEYRRHRHNRGHIATYNEGLLDWARGDYSLLLSADDGVLPGALTRAVKLMDRHREVVMTYGMALIVGEEGATGLPREGDSEDYRILSGESFIRQCCAFGNPVPTPTAVVRTQVQHRLGGYRKDLPHTGDMEMWMRFAANGRIGVVRAVQGLYRRHAANMSTAYFEDPLRDQRERLRTCALVLQQWRGRLPQAAELGALVQRRIAEEAFWMGSKAFDSGDGAVADACLRFAVAQHPDIRKSGMWRRFQGKRLLGARAWRRLRPALDRVRGRSRASGAQFETGSVNGWWPGNDTEIMVR